MLLEEFGGLALAPLENSGYIPTIPDLLEIASMRHYRDMRSEWLRDNKSDRLTEGMKNRIMDVQNARLMRATEKAEGKRSARGERLRQRRRPTGR